MRTRNFRLIVELVLITLMLAGSGYVATAAPQAVITPTPPTPPPPRLLFVGDSLTRGAFASNETHDYASLVAAGLHGRVVQMQGRYGYVTANVVGGLRSRPADAADIVVIELGTNDVGKTPLVQFAATYGELTGLLRRDEPHARFVCLGVWRAPNQDGIVPAGSPYDAVIQQACPGRFVPLAPLYMTWPLHGPQGRATWLGFGDWFHPNNSGHAAIAYAVLAALSGPTGAA